MGGVEGGDDQREEVASERPHDPQSNRSRQRIGPGAGHRLDIGHVAQDPPRPGRDLGADRGQSHPGARTLHQLHPEFGLELLKLGRQGRLGHPEPFRRAPEMQAVGDGDEVAELLKCRHVRSIIETDYQR